MFYYSYLGGSWMISVCLPDVHFLKKKKEDQTEHLKINPISLHIYVLFSIFSLCSLRVTDYLYKLIAETDKFEIQTKRCALFLNGKTCQPGSQKLGF